MVTFAPMCMGWWHPFATREREARRAAGGTPTHLSETTRPCPAESRTRPENPAREGGGGVEFDDWQLHQVSQRDWERLSGGFAQPYRSPTAMQTKAAPNLSPFPLSLSLMCLARARRRETPNVRGRCALSAGMRGAMGCDGIAPLSRHLSASHTRALARVQAGAHFLSPKGGFFR